MRLQKIQQGALLISTLLLLLMMNVTAYAHVVPDGSQKGSISVSMAYDGAVVSGGTLTLYRVGEIYEDDGNYGFALTGKFAESGIELNDLESSALAESLAAYAFENGATSIASEEVGASGIVVFSGLELGLYLIVQGDAADGYAAIVPFLIGVPMNEDGTYIYEVDASPKVELRQASTPDEPTESADPTLPQTGQLNWPVPVLAVLGLCLILLGWALRFGKKEGPDAA